MEHFCRLVMMGRATADPVRRSPGLNSFVTLGFVVNDKYLVRDEWRDRAMYIDCEMSGELGDWVMEHVRRGYLILVEGRLQLDDWLDSAKVRRRQHKVIAADVKILQRPGGKISSQISETRSASEASEPEPL